MPAYPPEGVKYFLPRRGYGGSEMTHDELLAELDSTYDLKTHNALRAVAELHPMGKVIEKTLPNTEYTIGYFICRTCSHIADKPIAYPCPTIQAIERALEHSTES